MMTQRVEEYEATCKETMDCVMEQFGTEAFMNMDANTFKLANAGLQVTKAEAGMLDQIDSKLNDLNRRLLLINKIES